MLERTDLFRGAIEDRYVSAFLDSLAPGEPDHPRADLFATAIEVLRVAALSSYENHAISSGVLLLDKDEDREHGVPPRDELSYRYSQALTGIKSFYRMCDGIRTLFLVNRQGSVLDIVDVARLRPGDPARGAVPDALSRARAGDGRQPEDLHRAEPVARDQGVRAGRADVQLPQRALAPARHEGEVRHVGGGGRPPRAGRTAVPDRASISPTRGRARCSSCCAIPQASLPTLVSPADQLDAPHGTPGDAPTRGQMMYMLRGRTATGLDRAVLMGLARTDGATVMDATGRLLAIGAILLHPGAAGAALHAGRRRRADDRRDGRRPARRRAEGQRGRPDHVLRPAGADLGYLIQLPASSCPLPVTRFPLTGCFASGLLLRTGRPQRV